MAIFGGLLAALLALAALLGCGALFGISSATTGPSIDFAPIAPQAEPTFRSDVQVTDVQVRVLDSNPAQVELDVTGLVDMCNYPVNSQILKDGRTVNVELFSDIPLAATCPAGTMDYTGTIALGIFEAGTYTIWVNGFSVEVTI